MTKLRLDITMSLDGFVAGPNASLEDPLGKGGMRFDVLEVEGSRIERIAVEFIERPTSRRNGDDLLAPEDDLE